MWDKKLMTRPQGALQPDSLAGLSSHVPQERATEIRHMYVSIPEPLLSCIGPDQNQRVVIAF